MKIYELEFNGVKIVCVVKEGELVHFSVFFKLSRTCLRIHELPVKNLETLISLLEEGDPESIKKFLIKVKDFRLYELEALKKVIKNL